MNEYQAAAHQLAQAIAGMRIAERNANRSLVVAECEIHNLANRARVAAAMTRFQAGIAAGTAQLGD